MSDLMRMAEESITPALAWREVSDAEIKAPIPRRLHQDKDVRRVWIHISRKKYGLQVMYRVLFDDGGAVIVVGGQGSGIKDALTWANDKVDGELTTEITVAQIKDSVAYAQEQT